MEINNGDICPLIKVKSPVGIDFYTEHKRVIESYGYVWFCRFGKNNMKRETLEKYSPFIIIKESGVKYGGVFLAAYSEISVDTMHQKMMPLYYKEIEQRPSLWFKVTQIEQIDYSALLSCFIGNASGGNIERIMKSMCPAFYIKCISNMKV